MVVHIAPKIIRLVAVKEIREDGVRSWEASQPLLQDRIVDVCDPEIIIDVPCTASKKSPERYILSKGVSPLQVPGPKLQAGSSSDPPTIPTDCPQPRRAFHLEYFIQNISFAYLALERPKNGNIFKLRRRRGRRIPTRKALEENQSSDFLEYYSHPMKPSSRVF